MSYSNNRQKPSKGKMLQWIDMISFACYEALLYLDTHPCDRKAMEYYEEYRSMRVQALKDFAELYTPLTADTAIACGEEWKWAMDKWPWEGGEC